MYGVYTSVYILDGDMLLLCCVHTGAIFVYVDADCRIAQYQVLIYVKLHSAAAGFAKELAPTYTKCPRCVVLT